MRRLVYIPIIHEEVDLGSTGSHLAQDSASRSGDDRWTLHRKTLEGFWNEVERYLRRFDARTLRVYQDGLAAGGDLGARIAEEASKRGSRNYRLVHDLLRGGAELRVTEDPALLLLEAARFHGPGPLDQATDTSKNTLERRDAFIARQISSTLREGELGVLFMGAVHCLISHLAADIHVQFFKDPEKLLEYVHTLLAGTAGRARLGKLADYVSGPADECLAARGP